MKCAKAKKFISEYIDGDLDEAKTSSLEKHLDTCPDCQELLKDFEQIKQEAKGLAKVEPSDQTWFQIQTRIKEKTQAPIPEPRVRFLFFPARLRYAVSTALLLFIAAGAVFIGTRVLNREGRISRVNGQELALAKIQEAEQHYKLAIKALWEAVQAQQENFDPKVAETFRINLELIDASLADCERAIKNDPYDLESQYYLLAVYKKKAELLDNMIDISSTAPQKKESKTII
ncbi:MAG: zf-HC2 domain-containing protein [Candidatus Aminicenantes bacterium]|nr:MAG: zf-HC2 domain-containing protein [Candidatus Aminicenantes bacterium]